MTTSAPRLLFISPVLPAATGNGLAMRAGMLLDALARDHEVDLLVITVSGPADVRALPPFVTDRVHRVAVQSTVRADDAAGALYRAVFTLQVTGARSAETLDSVFAHAARARRASARSVRLASLPAVARHATDEAVREAATWFAGAHYDVVHVMRLYMAPFGEPYQTGNGAPPVCVLDMDDDESTKYGRLSRLHQLHGEALAGEAAARDAQAFARMEAEYLPAFDAVLVCSSRDASEFRARHGLQTLHVVPNAVEVRSPEAAAQDLDCLFVGSLEYFPNIDGLGWFRDEILPRLRQLRAGPVRVGIVGRAAPEALADAMRSVPGVIFAGEVPDVAPWYRRARLAVVPLRAGGGTRIKVLEAFAHGVPVVSTTMGAEGLEVTPDHHLVLADSPEAFASACDRLLDDGEFRSRLAVNAAALVRARYSHDVVKAKTAALYSRLREGRHLGRRAIHTRATCPSEC